MPVLILDPSFEDHVMKEREALGLSRYDEVWEGVTVVPPMPNTEHQILSMQLWSVLEQVVAKGGLGQVFPPLNISDRVADWTHNYRCPDINVFLNGNPAVDHGTHWTGGPDFLIEVLSRGDDARDKLAFYAAVNTREVLVVDRHPWQLELYQLQQGQLTLAGRRDLDQPVTLTSSVLPAVFRLVPGSNRPSIEITHAATGQCWVV